MVKKADSLGTPIYQASVEVMESGKPFKSIKTYFDGTFKFTPNKEQSYIVKISYDGYKDTTYMFTTNGKGVPSAQNVNVRLKKDGMRLMGVIKGSDENFPIKEATIILRNVMTRKEERQTTGIDGRFNFKLDYETNYKVSIDKRSVGILNRYKDTSFYVATIGFNLPLDYKIDIILDPLFAAVTTPREGYDPTKANNANIKPVIEVKPSTGNNTTTTAEEKQPFVIEDRKLKTAQDANNKLTQELEKAKKEIEEFKKKEAEQKKLGNGALSKGKSRGGPDPEVVVITDEPVNKKATDDTALLAIIRQKEAAEKRALEIEAQIAKQKAEEQKKLEELTKANEAALAKAREDSILRVRIEQERIAREDSLSREIAAARAKAVQDSIARVQTEIATREKMRQDSIAQAQAAQIKLDLEKAVRKAYQDSVNQVLAVTRARATQDSLARVKAERDKAAHEEILRKAYQDSVSKVITATRARFIKDSVTRVQKEQERIAVVLAAKRAYEDSMTRVIAAVKNKMVQDSVAKVKADLEAKEKARQEAALREKREKEKLEKVLADKKAYQDSVDNVLAFNRKKFVEDSVAKAKADQEFRDKTKQEAQLREKQEQERMAKLLAEKKAYEDSVRNVLSSTRAQYIQDSLALVKAGRDAKEKAKQEAAIRVKEEQERQARQQAARKAFEDSLAREVAAVKARFAQDSILKAKAALAAREQARQDSVYRVKREQERIAKDLAAKRAYEDSINQIVASVREKFVRDSIAKEKAAQALRDKARQDSIALAKAAQERIERELIARRAYQDSISKVIAAVQEKFTRDSIAKEKAAQALRDKAKQDSIAQAKEAQQRVERERMAQQAYADSVRKVVAAVREKFVRDSIAKEKAALAIKEKAVQDSIALVKAAQERIARELRAKQAYEDSVKKVVALVHEKFVRDSIAKEKAALAIKEKARQDSIALVLAAQERITKELRAKQAYEDSVKKVVAQVHEKFVRDSIAREAAAQAIKEKARQDSIALALATQQRIEQEKAARRAYEDSVNKVMAAMHQKFAQDSINKAKADEERASRELALRKAFEDITTLRAKLTADSLIKVKAEAMAVEKNRQDSLLKVREAEAQLAKELAAKQAYVDSVNKAVAEARARYVQDSIAEVKANMAALEKARKDSIAQAKAEQERLAREEAVRKATEDSIAKVNAEARARYVKDSIELVKAAMLAEKAARDKARQDSILAAKAEQQRLAQQAAMRKAQQDSIAKANAEARVQFVKDSVAQANAAAKAEKAAREKAKQDMLIAEQERIARETAMKKAEQDSINKAKAVRAQYVKDSMALVTAAMEAEKTARDKARQDSLLAVKAEQQRLAQEAAIKKAEQDSINKANAAARAQFVKDSVEQARAQLAAEQAARDKAKQDSLLAVKAEQQRLAQEAAIKKAELDSINKANAAARAQFVKDSAEQARAQQAAEQAVRDKAKQDSLAAIKANLDRLANDVAARRVYVDSVNRAAAMAKAQAYEDSLARERAKVYAREKVKQDSLNAINEQLERIGNDYAARRAFVDSINRMAAMARAQAYEDSIARAKAKAQQQRLTKELSQQQLRESGEREKRERDELLNFGTNSQPQQSTPVQQNVVTEIAHDYTVSSETVQPDYSKMPAILFNKNTAIISEGSKAALKVLAQTLMKNPMVAVNIYAFASADEANTREVSLQRSDAVLRYLITNGASVGQIKSFYNGTTPSRNGCDNPNCPEGLLMQNRAVAYQLVQ
jgi:hypothetical protein